jgi:hypothetical protein
MVISTKREYAVDHFAPLEMNRLSIWFLVGVSS